MTKPCTHNAWRKLTLASSYRAAWERVADLPAGLRKVLDDSAFTEGARAMAAEIAALPDVSECLPILEQLASKRSKRDPGDDRHSANA